MGLLNTQKVYSKLVPGRGAASEAGGVRARKYLALYLHIPICQKRCLYCDFVSFVKDDFKLQDYVTALIEEIHRYKQLNNYFEVVSVYIGGGTPSLLSIEQLTQIITAIKSTFTINKNIEFTMEINPQTVNLVYLKQMKALGINRLSIGVQSFQDKFLQKLGRIHDSKQALDTISNANLAGFSNVSIDLIFGISEQNLQDIKKEIEQIKALNIQHISWYNLIVEDHTPLSKLCATKTDYQILEDDLLAQMYYYIQAELKQIGFIQYETSNYAKENYSSLHNQAYWQHQNYLGLGLGAVSFFRPIRNQNASNFSDYLAGKKALEKLNKQELKFETIFLALRTKTGLDITKYNQFYKADFMKDYSKEINKLLAKNLIKIENNHLTINSQYEFVANSIVGEFC